MVYFLIDCNNFYASCERVFQPKLVGKPVIVLSNNDGCFISRSDEVKHLGIPMGAPYFKYKEEVERMKAKVFSANFSLYGDISNRVMTTLATFSDKMEIYSIDEAFLAFDDDIPPEQLTALGKRIRKTVRQWTGIPVSVGIGTTKTLAKLANKIARKNPERTEGVYNFLEEPSVDTVLQTLPVELIWGIGRQSQVLLNSYEIRSVLQLKQAHDKWLRAHMGVVGVRIAWELRGIPCIALEEVRPTKKGIMSSRSFGRPVTTLKELQEAVATYTSRAAEKLREDKCLAGCISVMVLTDRFKPDEYYGNRFSMPLPRPTAYTPQLSAYALMALDKIYLPRRKYKKAAIMLTGIVPETEHQLNLFQDTGMIERQKKVMRAFDSINRRYGRHIVRYAAEGTTQLWGNKSEQRSPSFTTDWSKLPRVS